MWKSRDKVQNRFIECTAEDDSQAVNLVLITNFTFTQPSFTVHFVQYNYKQQSLGTFETSLLSSINREFALPLVKIKGLFESTTILYQVSEWSLKEINRQNLLLGGPVPSMRRWPGFNASDLKAYNVDGSTPAERNIFIIYLFTCLFIFLFSLKNKILPQMAQNEAAFY